MAYSVGPLLTPGAPFGQGVRIPVGALSNERPRRNS